jgi:hypothetical protein
MGNLLPKGQIPGKILTSRDASKAVRHSPLFVEYCIATLFGHWKGLSPELRMEGKGATCTMWAGFPGKLRRGTSNLSP